MILPSLFDTTLDSPGLPSRHDTVTTLEPGGGLSMSVQQQRASTLLPPEQLYSNIKNSLLWFDK